MKLHYMGKYNLDPVSLPHREHILGAVPFKEAKDTKQMAVIANIGCILVIVLLAIPAVFLCWNAYDGMSAKEIPELAMEFCFGAMTSMLLLLPHELLHAICFKKDVYLYTNWKQGMLFVVGPETMSKGRFVFMSLLPNPYQQKAGCV